MANFNEYPAKGVDAKILLLQNVLANQLKWENVNIFGRVSRVLSSDGRTDSAEFYNSGMEGTDVYFDDQKAKTGSIFFIDSTEHKPFGVMMKEATVKIVFMVDLKLLYPNASYRADAQVHEYVENIIRQTGALKDISSQTGIKNVFEGFNTVPIKDYDIQPLHVFSINGKIRYYKSTCN